MILAHHCRLIYIILSLYSSHSRLIYGCIVPSPALSPFCTVFPLPGMPPSSISLSVCVCVCVGASLHQLIGTIFRNFAIWLFTLQIRAFLLVYLFVLGLVFKHLLASLCLCFLSGSPFHLKPFPPRRLPHYPHPLQTCFLF